MGRYLAADSVAYALWVVTIGVLPLLVLNISGAAANAEFFVAWAIAYSLYLISTGMCQSLLAEASVEPASIGAHARRARRDVLALVALGAAVVVVLGPALLGLLGGRYSAESSTTLRLLALSAVPFVFVCVEVYSARAAGRMRLVVGAYASLCGLVLAIGVPLLNGIGIEGLGVAWLAAQSLVAAGLGLRGRQWRAPELPAPTRMRALERALRPLEEDWRLGASRTGGGDVTIRALGPAGSPPAAIVRLARGARGGAALARADEGLRALHGGTAPAAVRALLPRRLADGTAGGRLFTVETALPGAPATQAIAGGLSPERFAAAAREALAPLHRATAKSVKVGEPELERWVDRPVALLRDAFGDPSAPALERLRCRLRAALERRTVDTCFVHGDLWPGNVLLSDGGAVSGIVDWEAHQPRGLAEVELTHLLLTTRAVAQRRELGDVVVDALRRPLAREDGLDFKMPAQTLVLLAWLGHVAGNLTKSGRYALNPRWRQRNVAPVLELVGRRAVLARSRPRRSRVSAGAWLGHLQGRLPATTITLGCAVWIVALSGVDRSGMSDLGLVSILPTAALGALVLLCCGFAMAVHRPLPSRAGIVAALIALVAVLHATPPLLYGTARYSWAWKHVGIVDYVERHHAVSPDIGQLPVYHNWPGFFGLDALLVELGGAADAIGHALWGPLVFTLLNLAAVLFLLGGLTRERSVVWRGAWLFLVASWVGQDYFAPQAFGFFLYLVLIGVVVRWRGRLPSGAQLALALGLVATITVSHPLTGVMTVIVLVALTVFRVCAVLVLALAAAAMTFVWDITFAAPYTVPNAVSVLGSARLPWVTTEEGLAATGRLSDGQVLVAFAGRALVLVLIALAAIGVVRLLRSDRLSLAAPVLAVAPFALFAAGDYDGEMLFRIYLFATPGLAFLAAHAFSGRGHASLAAFATASVLILGLFVLAHYGKDHQYAFSRGEVAASRFVAEHAVPGTLLVEGTPNYPGSFATYEWFVRVPLSREDAETQARVIADPVGVLSEWLTNPRYPRAYLILTESQRVETEEVGSMASGSLATIRRALLASPRFRVAFRARDAVVITAAAGGEQ
jgi:hypothetical protein